MNKKLFVIPIALLFLLPFVFADFNQYLTQLDFNGTIQAVGLMGTVVTPLANMTNITVNIGSVASLSSNRCYIYNVTNTMTGSTLLGDVGAELVGGNYTCRFNSTIVVYTNTNFSVMVGLVTNDENIGQNTGGYPITRSNVRFINASFFMNGLGNHQLYSTGQRWGFYALSADNITPPAPPANLTIYAYNTYTNETIRYFSATVNGTLYTTTNTSITTNLTNFGNISFTIHDALAVLNRSSFINYSLIGSVINNGANADDGNFNTFANVTPGAGTNAFFNWNYTIPSNVSKLVWRVKDGGTESLLNNTQVTCPITSNYQLRAQANPTGRLEWQCFDGAAWQQLRAYTNANASNASVVYEQQLLYVGYFNRTQSVNLANVTGDGVNLSVAQTNYTLYAYDKVTRLNISSANFTSVTGTTTYLQNVTHYFAYQDYNITANATAYYSATSNLTPAVLGDYTQGFELYSLIANISAFNFYTNSTVSNIVVNVTNQQYNFTEYQASNNGTVRFNISASVLYNITIASNDSSGYISRTVTNANLSTQQNYSMIQSEYVFYAQEKVTGANISGANFSAASGSTVYRINVTQYMAYLNFNVTFFKTGYSNRTIAFTPVPLTVGTQNISYITNTTLNITAFDNLTLAPITIFGVDLSNTTYNYSEAFATNTGIVLDNTTTVRLNYNISSVGYFTRSGTITLTGTSNNVSIGLAPTGSQAVRFVNVSNGAFITTLNGTVTFENSTNSLAFTANSGLANATGLVQDTYSVHCQMTGYDNNSFVYTYPNESLGTPSTIFCFMTQGAVPITIGAQSPDGNPLADVQVTVEQFVNGTLQNITSDFTDGTGQVVINLRQGLTTFITLERDGYLSQTNVNNLDTTTYIYTMSPVNRFDPSNSAGSDVIYSFTPTQFDLNLTVWNFTLNVDPVFNNLEYFKIDLYTQNYTLIATNTSTNASGGFIYIALDVTPYNTTVIHANFSFKKQNSTSWFTIQNYNVLDVPYTGTTSEMREYIINNFDLMERIFLWFFITAVFAIIIYKFGIVDIANVLVTVMFWTGVGWLFGMNMILVGAICFFIIVMILRFSI